MLTIYCHHLFIIYNSPTNCPAKCTGYPANNFFISSSIGPFPTKANLAPGLLSNTE